VSGPAKIMTSLINENSSALVFGIPHWDHAGRLAEDDDYFLMAFSAFGVLSVLKTRLIFPFEGLA